MRTIVLLGFAPALLVVGIAAGIVLGLTFYASAIIALARK